MATLFSDNVEQQTKPPLAERLRPRSLDSIIGQHHLLGEQAALRKRIESGEIGNIILWGPPGCGKTTLARLIADHVQTDFKPLSAIFTGVADLKSLFAMAKQNAQSGRKTVLFVDEIHRFNKAQQDAFLPVMEDGTITLIGATTENPSFALNNALLSRAHVYTLKRLETDDLTGLLGQIIDHEDIHITLDDDACHALIRLADGDARALIGLVEQLNHSVDQDHLITGEALSSLLDTRPLQHDKSDDGHYNLLSALHKSVRASDVDASLYWLARLLQGGEDPRIIARRMTRMASEDLGLAAPQALSICLDAWNAYERLGHPEGELALAQALIYLASAPKSNAVYTAYNAATRAARDSGSLPPQMHSLNAPTQLMKKQGYYDGYQYDHNDPDGFSGQNHFPSDIGRPQFYHPKQAGFEKEIAGRLQEWDRLRRKKNPAA